MTIEKKPVKTVNKKSTKKQVDYDKSKKYSIEEAIEISKKHSKTKFDASVEIHFNLSIDPKKGEQQVRSAVSLPHGTGKSIKVAAFVTPDKEKEVKAAGADFVGGEDLINEIKKSEKTDFQVAVAEPAIMKDLGKIAKILGTRGLMPSPKNETITLDPAKAIEELKKGKVSFKNDDTGNLHSVIGKISFDNEKLVENFNTFLDAVKKARPASTKGIYINNVSISSSMGPGVKIEI
jgi:large subunit ribosomal protein L1